MAEPILETAGLSHSFGALRAVDDVSLKVGAGTVTGLIGPNGAGKSTLFNLLTGMLRPDAGRIRLRGRDVTGQGPGRLFAMGLARTFQIPRPFPRLSVLDNVLAAPPDQAGERLLGAFLARSRMRAQERAARARAMEVLDFVTLADLALHPAGALSGGQMKLLELARVLMGDPAIILLDEPAAGVNPTLARLLVDRIETLNRDHAKTFLIIEHDRDLVMRHCDPVIALAEGRVIFEGSAAEAQANPALLDAYLGAPADG